MNDEKKTVEMTVKDYGPVRIEIDCAAAPMTAANFLKLAGEGFYDGLTFHRIIDGFMIQGGDPTGTGFGGSDENVRGEFASNGFPNPISHKEGVISMARSSNPDSASSQFFITVGDASFLDGEYAAFGRVTDGYDVVRLLAREARVVDGNGTVRPEDQPRIETIKIINE